MVCPDKVLPDLSVIVPDIIKGRSTFSASKISLTAWIAALALRVSNIVSIIIISEPPLIKPFAANE